MLKGIKKIILLIILLIPFMVIADEKYQTSIDYANSYIDSFVDYQNYILFPESGYYYDETLKNDNFNHGGFLSRKEYLITNYNNKSYLSPGVQYWTLTSGLSDNNKRYVIDYTDKEYEKNNMSGVRVTEFILPRTRVNGNGTRSNPWHFLPKYKVILSTTDYKKGGISDKLGNGCNNPNQILTTSIYEDENIDIQLCPSSGYEYYNTDCSINISKLINTNMIRISNVKKNTSCKINFIVTVYKISLDTNGGSKIDTKELYLAPNRYWFKEKDDRITETQITKIDKLPTKTGYTFNGFYLDKTSDIKLIDEAGNLISTSGYTTDGTMYARYNANKYTVTFDQQEGTGGTPSVTVTYDSAMPVITEFPTREGYKFAGYYSEENGKGTKYYNANGTSANNWNIASDTTLYAYWTPNKLNIVFNANGATIKNEVELKGTKYYWQLNTNGNIKKSKDNNKYTESFYSKNYTENINLPDYNNSNYIKLTKTGYTALSGKEWCTNSDGSGECFDQAATYSAKDICPTIVSGDCNITLYTNWKIDKITCTETADLNNIIQCGVEDTSKTINYTGKCSYECESVDNFKIKFLTSGTLTINSTLNIDAFLVGGGGGGNTSDTGVGGAGGGGYAKTIKNITLSSGTYEIEIGAGGGRGAKGGETSIMQNKSIISDLIASGGNGGGAGGGYLSIGGSGGSGGGGFSDANIGMPLCHGRFGNDGSFNIYSKHYYSFGQLKHKGPRGEIGSTCEFGQGNEAGCYTGVAEYSGGGCCGVLCKDIGLGGGGGSCGGGNGTANTGGGGGAYFSSTGKGGSGIVIIRNKR